MSFLASLFADTSCWLPCNSVGQPASRHGVLDDWRERGGKLREVQTYANQHALGIGINLARAPELVVVAFPIGTKGAARLFDRFIQAYPTYAENTLSHTFCYYTTIGSVSAREVNVLGARIMARNGFAPVSLKPIDSLNMPLSIVEAAIVEEWMKGDLL